MKQATKDLECPDCEQHIDYCECPACGLCGENLEEDGSCYCDDCETCGKTPRECVCDE